MTTYLLPCYSKKNGLWIEKVRARDFADAKQKFITAYIDDYEDVPSDWDDMIDMLKEQDIEIGDIYDIEEF